MPSVAQESPSVQSSKKRRRDDHDDPLLSLASAGRQFPPSQYASLVAQKLMSIPPGKRHRTLDVDIEAGHDPMDQSPSSSPSGRPIHHDHHRGDHRSRNEDKDRPSPLSRPSTTTTSTQAPSASAPSSSSSSLMARCHVCSRKPRTKSDLDSFADCQGCGQRTCYVCIRECLGWGPPHLAAATAFPTTTTITTTPSHPPTPLSTVPIQSTIIPSSAAQDAAETSFTMLDADEVENDTTHEEPPPHEPSGSIQQEHHHHQQQERWGATGGGHRQVVCSRCCVERGPDGDVVCLGCLPFVEG
ncbi:hypothetical protein VTJ04DRAFT_1030 [Mycothermus thermophilus]|uniref:uncharacterized protein n=1 Tax=Humicola insolens TaxID=85995 RepID=UPI00374233B2